MKLVDTHCHIYLNDFNQDLDEVLSKARTAGVEKFFLPNIDTTTLEPLHRLVIDHMDVYPMAGLHPSSVKEDYQSQLAKIYSYLKANSDKIIAIGETGIDLYWDTSTLEVQISSFKEQIRWALEFDLPLVIHSRNSFNEIAEVLNPLRNTGLKGVFHCFTGDKEQAAWIVDFGFYLGIGGVVTYKKTTLPDVLKHVPLERILTETDAPYLSPMPHRGKRNEPALMVETVKKLSEIYSKSFSELASITWKNAKNLFPIAWR